MASSLKRTENRLYKRVLTELEEVTAAHMNALLKKMLKQLKLESFYYDEKEE